MRRFQKNTKKVIPLAPLGAAPGDTHIAGDLPHWQAVSNKDAK
ncbi:MAG: hypothetical protein ACJARR_001458 [Pseudophaeobacter arcticus]|jgi:hypothetical protein